jgi:putative hydrolase of the HAD superfamily
MTDGALNRFERYLSHEIGQAKPSPDSFHHMAALASITPARSIFFDDLIENVEGAREAGFQAYVFESEEQLATLLTAAGVRLA